MSQDGDNALSAAEMEYNVLLEEFRSLKSEIRQRIDNQHTILTILVALIGGIIAILQFLGKDSLTLSLQSLHYILPTLSIVFSALALMYMEHDATNAILGGYINGYLQPHLKQLLRSIDGRENEILGWENVFRGWN